MLNLNFEKLANTFRLTVNLDFVDDDLIIVNASIVQCNIIDTALVPLEQYVEEFRMKKKWLSSLCSFKKRYDNHEIILSLKN